MPPAGAAGPPIGADGAAQRGRRALNPLSVAGNLEYDRVLFAGNTRQPAAPVFYASCVAGAGLLELAVWLYAIRAKGLVPASVSPPGGVHRSGRGAVHMDPARAHRPDSAPHHAGERDRRGR